MFRTADGQPIDLLELLRTYGVNTVRLRLWVDPDTEHSGWREVSAFSERLRRKGFRIWLAVHYSDTWADPARQEPPKSWASLDFPTLRDSVQAYTLRIAAHLRPEFIQIGNEINTGLLHPFGDLYARPEQCRDLLNTAIQAVRQASPDSKIILHFAGIAGAAAFFEKMVGLDYDIIGISYYPWWHGKSLADLRKTLDGLHKGFQKEVLIAETAYPFTLGWSDWTHNIVGQEEQLILPDFPATPEGQRDFINHIGRAVRTVPGASGFCYWGAEWVAWKGPAATDGSPWENQALFDFDHRALPAWEALSAP